MSDIRQTPEWGHFLESLGWKTERVGEAYVYVRRLPVIGSILKIPRSSESLNVTELDTIARRQRALFVKIDLKKEVSASQSAVPEPLNRHGFRSENWTLAPAKTFVLDISPSREELLAHFEKDTRYSINSA